MTRLTFAHLICISALTFAAAAADANEALAKKYACAACHQTDRKVIGPTWKDVATKYADGSVTAAQLAVIIKNGSARPVARGRCSNLGGLGAAGSEVMAASRPPGHGRAMRDIGVASRGSVLTKDHASVIRDYVIRRPTKTRPCGLDAVMP
jgi:cytochrome c551/c552